MSNTTTDRLTEMKGLAEEEARNLKQYATKEEIERLDAELIDPDNSMECIYGLIAGHCSNARANELIMLCAPRVYDIKPFLSVATDSVLNGKPYEPASGFRHREYQTPIEVIIYEKNGGEEAQRKIVAFLKDETQEIKL